jgi:hypothetical protein
VHVLQKSGLKACHANLSHNKVVSELSTTVVPFSTDVEGFFNRNFALH